MFIFHCIVFLCPHLNHHGISKRKKPIPFFNSSPVCLKCKIPSSKSADQHNQCRFWQMKICNYCVHNFKLIAGINEDIRPSRASRNGPRTRSSSLKRANRRCADRNDTTAFFLCRLNKQALQIKMQPLFQIR